MSHERIPAEEQGLSSLVTKNYRTIANALSARLAQGQTLDSPELDKNEDLPNYLRTLIALITAQPPTLQGYAVTYRSFHFSYVLAAQVTQPGFLFGNFYEMNVPSELAEKIKTSSLSYLAANQPLDDMITEFLPMLTGDEPAWNDLARTVCGLGLYHVEDYRSAVKADRLTVPQPVNNDIEQQVAAFSAQLDTLTPDSFR